MTAPAARNPFPAQGTSSMEEHVLEAVLLDWATQAPTSKLPHVQRLAGMVKQYLMEPARPTQAQAVFVTGEHGTGKTHALRYALGQGSFGAEPLRLYAKAEDDDFLLTYRHLMSQLGRPELRDLALRYRAVLATERATGYQDEVLLIEAARRDPEKVAELFNQMLVAPGTVLDAQAEELARIADDGADFERALDALLDPALGQNAYDWLTGNDIDDRTAHRLGVDGPILEPTRARFGLQLLSALCTRVGRPLIIVIDQIERLALRSGKPHTPNIGLLHSLVERIPANNGMIILLGNPSAWAAFPLDLQERFGALIQTQALSPAEASDILTTYIEDGSSDRFQLEPEAFALLLSASGGNTRRLLQIAWAVYDLHEPRQTSVERATVATAVNELDREPLNRESADESISKVLRAGGLGFQRDWRSADYAVLAKEHPLLLLQVLDSMFAAESPKSHRLNRSVVSRQHGEGVLLVTIVLGYASPRTLSRLRSDSDEVIVVRKPEDLDPLRVIIERVRRSTVRPSPSSYPGKLVLLWASIWTSTFALALTLLATNTAGLLRYGTAIIAILAVGSPPAIRFGQRALADSRYRQRLAASTAPLETIGLATQSEYVLRAEQVVVDVRLYPRPVHETLQAGLVAAPAMPDKGAPLAHFIDRGRVLVLLGGPGTGKTTLLRNVTHSLCSRPFFSLRRRPLPILLYVRDHVTSILSEDPPDLHELTISSTPLDGSISSDQVRASLQRGRCTVMLDGLDEVPDEEDRRKVTHWIEKQIAASPENAFIVTSRPRGYISNPLSHAEVLQLLRFNGDQISLFIHRWYEAINRRTYGSDDAFIQELAVKNADDLLSRIRLQSDLYELASNPLLLTMIATVHRYRGALPGSRAMLYAEMCDVLLFRRQEAKNLRTLTELSGPKKKYVIQQLALHMMRYRLRDISADAAAAVVRESLVRASGRTVSPADFLVDVSASGLLVERESGMYAFAHLTLQEYLAAQTIHDSATVRSVLLEELGDPWWRETTLLWATMSDASPVVAACLSVGTVSALALAFDCADIAQELDPALRDRLEELLDPEHEGLPEDAGRRRLVSGVAAARAFRERIMLDEAAYLCLRPVDRYLFALFLLDAARADQQISGFLRSRQEPASGLRSGDILPFVGWLNSLIDDGAEYRLPTGRELSSASRLGVLPERRPIWLNDGDHQALATSEGIRWPHGPVVDIGSVLRGCLAPAFSTDAAVLFQAASLRADRERLGRFTAAVSEIEHDWPDAEPSARSNRLDSAIELLRDRAQEAQTPSKSPQLPTLALRELSESEPRERVQDAMKAIEPINEPVDSMRMVIALTELFAALLTGSGDPRRDAILAQAIVGLIAANAQGLGALAPDDLLMLVRD